VNMRDELATLRPDCRHFRGHLPCKPHKEHGVHCKDCEYYEPVRQRILIIKLGAIGDVIRTTPILHRLKAEFPGAEISWLTYSPEVVPQVVDRVLAVTPENLLLLQQTFFDLLLNLDKDAEACAIASAVPARQRRGYILRDGRPWPADTNAVYKFLTGLFDDVSKANTKSYPEEIFEICGYTFAGEEYILDVPEDDHSWEIDRSRPVVGLNTGCGGRWKSRLWPEEYWTELAQKLRSRGYTVLLLGGKDEDEKNRRIAARSGATYLGHFPLKRFISEMNQCDLVVTAVTMALHIAIGLKKKIVLFNNIFNRNEFELYGLGKILEPEMACDCYYDPVCPNDCMRTLRVETVLRTIQELLPLNKTAGSEG